MSCRQQTAPPQSRCSKDVTAHPHRPRARPDRPCPAPACSGQPLPGKRRFSSPLRNRIRFQRLECRALDPERIRLVALRWHASGSEVRLGLPVGLQNKKTHKFAVHADGSGHYGGEKRNLQCSDCQRVVADSLILRCAAICRGVSMSCGWVKRPFC